jgi:competence protein ComK
MIIVSNYRINEKTVYLTGVYDHFANQCSEVMDGEERFIVTVPPLELINNALLNNGSDFKGAMNSSRFILGDIKMPPIQINASLGIYLIPTRSFKWLNCIWFAHSHIIKTTAIGCKRTKAHLSFGHTYDFFMKESAFNQKRQRAQQLKEHITKFGQNSLQFQLDEKKGFNISEDQGHNEYSLFGKKDSGFYLKD